MQPKRYTHERARGPTDLHLSAPAAIAGATSGAARADRPRPRAQPLNPLEPAYPWYPVRKDVVLSSVSVGMPTCAAARLVNAQISHAASCWPASVGSHNRALPLHSPLPWLQEKQEAAPPPKFVRDTLDITDIAGAKVGWNWALFCGALRSRWGEEADRHCAAECSPASQNHSSSAIVIPLTAPGAGITSGPAASRPALNHESR